MSVHYQRRDWRGWLLLISLLVIALDRWSKLWIMKHIAEGMGKTIIPKVFSLTHVVNEGAAFSLFNDAPAHRTWLLLTGFSLLASVVVLAILLRIGKRFSAISLGLALVLGGAIGNAWDRIQYKVVTDFLEVYIYHYHWPDFNVADSAIVCGGVLLFLGTLFAPSSE